MIPPSRVQRGEFMDIFEASAMIMMSGGNKVIQPLNVTENGSYEVPEGVDGYNPVNVNVPSEAVTEGLSVTTNGTYTPPSGVDGYNPVTVNVDDRYDEGYADGESAVKAKIKSKSITANGIYYAADDGLDGFDPINVSVPDRYDEGYRDGYRDGYDFAKSFYGDDPVTPDTRFVIYISVRAWDRFHGRAQLFVEGYERSETGEYTKKVGSLQAWIDGNTEHSYGPNSKSRIDRVEWVKRSDGVYVLYIDWWGWDKSGENLYSNNVSVRFTAEKKEFTPSNTTVIYREVPSVS